MEETATMKHQDTGVSIGVTNMTPDDVESRCKMLSREYHSTAGNKISSILASLSLCEFQRSVNAGSPPTGETFAEAIVNCMPQLAEILRDNLLSVAISPRCSGGSMLQVMAGDCGRALLSKYIPLVTLNGFDDTPSRYIAVITYSGQMRIAESRLLSDFIPSMRGQDYTGTGYDSCMGWAKTEVTEREKIKMVSLLHHAASTV